MKPRDPDPGHAEAAPTSADLPAELAGLRLDRALAELWPQISRTRWKQAVRDGLVRVDGQPSQRPNASLRAGARLEVDLPLASVSGRRGAAPDYELEVLYEDEELAVIDKPAGLIVHANDRFGGGTLADLVRERYGLLPAVQGAHRRGIVHRLDRLTSGVIVIGRTERAQLALKEQFQARSVEKSYLAFCHGEPRFHSDWIESPIAPDPRHPGRQRALSPEREDLEHIEGLRQAATFYRVRTRWRGCVELECRPKTGRTHQIRVHLSSIGLPIIGDGIYRHPGALPWPVPEAVELPERQALHAARIEFDHPATGERLAFEAPLPADLLRLREDLERHLGRAGQDPVGG